MYTASVAEGVVQFSKDGNVAFTSSVLSSDGRRIDVRVLAGKEFKRGARLQLTVSGDWGHLRINEIPGEALTLLQYCGGHAYDWKPSEEVAAQKAAARSKADNAVQRLAGTWSGELRYEEDGDNDCTVKHARSYQVQINEGSATVDLDSVNHLSGGCRFSVNNSHSTRRQMRYEGPVRYLPNNSGGAISRFSFYGKVVACEGEGCELGRSWSPTLVLTDTNNLSMDDGEHDVRLR